MENKKSDSIFDRKVVLSKEAAERLANLEPFDTSRLKNADINKVGSVDELIEFIRRLPNPDTNRLQKDVDGYIKSALEARKLSLSSVLKDVLEDYAPEEVDWGKPVGREIW